MYPLWHTQKHSESLGVLIQCSEMALKQMLETHTKKKRPILAVEFI